LLFQNDDTNIKVCSNLSYALDPLIFLMYSNEHVGSLLKLNLEV
jgi:hypothetical protein